MILSNAIFGISAWLCCVIGTIGNFLILTYFLHKRKAGNKSTSNIIFICVNSVDILLCVLISFIGYSHLNDGVNAWFENELFCNLWGVLWNVLIRISIYLIAVLSITRAVSLVFPFKKIKRIYITMAIVIYILLQLIQGTVPFWYGVTYGYYSYFRLCGWTISKIAEAGSLGYIIIYFIFIVLEFILPLFPIVGSCALSIYYLRNNRTSFSQKSDTERKRTSNGIDINCETVRRNRKASIIIKRKASVTIVLLTLVYITFNIPVVVYYICRIVVMAFNLSENPLQTSILTNYYLRCFVFTHSIVLNSVCNTFVYYIRLGHLRQYTMELANLSKWSSSVRRNTKIHPGQFQGGRDTIDLRSSATRLSQNRSRTTVLQPTSTMTIKE